MMSQRLGNMELTLNALLMILEDKKVVDRDALNEKAQQIMQQVQEQQQAAQQAAEQAAEAADE